MGRILLTLIPGQSAWMIALFLGNVLGYAALLLRIASARLIRVYPVLSAWLVANIALAIVPFVVHMTLLFYFWFFMVAETCGLVLYLLAMLELYARALRSLPGLGAAIRIVIAILVPASAGAALWLVSRERGANYLDWFYRAQGAVIAALLFFVLTITAFIVWFPIRVTRNTVVYSLGYAAYLLPKAAALYLRNAGYGMPWLASATGMAMSGLCLVFWALAIKPEGERFVQSGGILQSPDDLRLMSQLEAVNQALLRVSQRLPQT